MELCHLKQFAVYGFREILYFMFIHYVIITALLLQRISPCLTIVGDTATSWYDNIGQFYHNIIILLYYKGDYFKSFVAQ